MGRFSSSTVGRLVDELRACIVHPQAQFTALLRADTDNMVVDLYLTHLPSAYRVLSDHELLNPTLSAIGTSADAFGQEIVDFLLKGGFYSLVQMMANATLDVTQHRAGASSQRSSAAVERRRTQRAAAAASKEAERRPELSVDVRDDNDPNEAAPASTDVLAPVGHGIGKGLLSLIFARKNATSALEASLFEASVHGVADRLLHDFMGDICLHYARHFDDFLRLFNQGHVSRRLVSVVSGIVSLLLGNRKYIKERYVWFFKLFLFSPLCTRVDFLSAFTQSDSFIGRLQAQMNSAAMIEFLTSIFRLEPKILTRAVSQAFKMQLCQAYVALLSPSLPLAEKVPGMWRLLL